MNTAEQKAQQEYPNEYRLNRSSERVAYIKGYAAGQEALPLAMSEEEIERIGKSISADHEFYRDAIGVTNIIDIVRQTLHNMSNWIKLEERMPEEGQYCWVAYHPWNSTSNKPAVQAATWRNGIWILDGEGGTSYPPIAWRPNGNQGPPVFGGN